MAEIVLNGQFNDQITPKLKRLEKQLNSVTKQFAKLSGKIRPVTKEMGRLAMASERVANAMKSQRQDITATTQALRAYTTASRKATSQQKKLKPARMPSAPRQTGGGGGAGGKSRSEGVIAGFAIAGNQIGNQLGSMIMMGLTRAFDSYKGLLLKPFKFLADGIQERIDDEMDDIKTAGGLFSISKRMEEPFIKNFAEAEALTKETNRYLAELAGSLPGDTQQYISVSRQISDGIYQVLANDKEGSLNLAKKIAEQNGRVLDYSSMNGAQQVQAAGKELVGEMTKLTVLGSLGQKQGAMGLPQLIEQMMSQDQVSSGQFKRYAAIFRDPLIKGALERNVPLINKAGKNTAERLEALKNTLDEVVTPDLVRRYQRSTAGVIEEMKTLFLNPEVGMLGLGRPLNHMAVVFNEFGQMVDKNNKVVTDAADAAREQLSIFDYVRDIFANLAIVMGPIIKAATQMFMGFEDLAEVLSNTREFTMKLQSNFEQYRVGLEELANSFEGDAKTAFLGTVPLRAGLATINNMLESFGVLEPGQFESFAKNLESADFTDFTGMISDMLQTFLSSEAATKFGNDIGDILGTILKSFADVILGLTDESNMSNMFTGFMEGFKGAGGIEAAKAILNKLVDAIGKVFLFLVTNFPMESFVLALVALAPAIVSGIVAALPAIFGALVGGGGLSAAFAGLGATISGWLGAVGPAFTAIGTWITGTLLPVLLGVVAPIAAVAGAVMGVVAVFRHLDFIASSLWEALKMLVNGIRWAGAKLQLALMTAAKGLIDGITGLLDKLGMGWVANKTGLRGASEGLGAQIEANKQFTKDMEEAMVKGASKIADNTAESWKRTVSDATKLAQQTGLDPMGLNKNKPAGPETVEVKPAGSGRSRASRREKAVVPVTPTPTTPVVAPAAPVAAPVPAVSAAPVTKVLDEVKGGITTFSTAATPAATKANTATTKITTDLTAFATNATTAGTTAATAMTKISTDVAAFGGSLTASSFSIQIALNSVAIAFQSLAAKMASMSATANAGGGGGLTRASGGYVNGGQQYLVGERGPEMFTPNVGGMVTPNSQLSTQSAGPNVSVASINISGVNDPKAIANTVADEILKAINGAGSTELYVS